MLPWKERKKRILMDESSQLISDNFENIRWQTTRAEPLGKPELAGATSHSSQISTYTCAGTSA